nr:MAG TPA: hypothetical protein [Bacteriophage sp.]
MAYENLKSAIKQVIKQNGNQEITGHILQSTLLSVVDNIPEVVQESGEAEDKVMSQKAVSIKFSDLENRLVVLGENEYNSIDKDENKIYFVYEEE